MRLLLQLSLDPDIRYEELNFGLTEFCISMSEIVQSCVQLSCVQVVSTGRRGRGGEGTLVLCVHHPEPSVREEAVRQLGRALRHRNKVSYIFSTSMVGNFAGLQIWRCCHRQRKIFLRGRVHSFLANC